MIYKMNTISTVFDELEARVESEKFNSSLDRITIRDYIKEVEIGAFQVERDLTQRLKFNVVVEVSAATSSISDDVDDILSYDMIIEAIDEQLDFERLNLLETLAERVSKQILSHKQAERVFIRIEKLDRIPGSLGVEIVRDCKDLEIITSIESSIINPLVVFIPNEVIQSNDLLIWLDAIVQNKKPTVICLESLSIKQPVSLNPKSNHRIELLAIEQNAWDLAGKDIRCVVVETRTELDWSMKNNELSVWAPSKIILDAVNKPKINSKPLDLAIWFANEFNAENIYYLGIGNIHPKVKVISTPNLLK